MKLYYTTTTGHLNENKIPSKSLGGYRSSTLIPNGALNSLFSDLSLFNIDVDREEYIAVCLYNDSTTKKRVFLWTENGNQDNPLYSKIEIAAVTMPEVNSYPMMEYVRSNSERPYVGEFAERTVDNKADLGEIDAQTGIGLWIKRSILKDVIDQDHQDFVQIVDQEKNQYKEKDFSTKDSIIIRIDYQDVI